MRPALAYLFERFPSFVQTFCVREVTELERQGLAVQTFSVRDPRAEEPGEYGERLAHRTLYVPGKEELRRQVREAAAARRLPRDLLPALQRWGDRPDKRRLYEAAWIGERLRAVGVRHLHCHFAGLAARTALWIKRHWGIGFSFTGHANDIFGTADFPVTLDDLVREARFVVTVSDFSARNLRARFPASAHRIHRVYNGIDPDSFPAADPARAAPEILSVGRLVEKKGFGMLVDACGRLRDGGAAFRCRIVGDGPLEGALRTRITALGLEDRVECLGACSQEEIARLLAETRVFALACMREPDGGMDNLPTVIVEAMCAGLPVVSTAVAGVPELVRDGQTGFLVPEGDTGALAGALGRMLGDSALAARLGQAGRERARAEFAASATVRRLKRLLVCHGRVRLSWEAIRRDPLLLSARWARW